MSVPSLRMHGLSFVERCPVFVNDYFAIVTHPFSTLNYLYMKSHWLLIYCFLFVSTAASAVGAQNYTFKVLTFDGSVLYKENSTDKWLPVDVGTCLNEQSTVKIAAHSYLGLVHTSGKTYTLQKGTYEIDRLAGKFQDAPTGVATKYADLFIEKTKTNVTAQPEDKERNLEARELKMLLPSSVDVYSPEVILRWKDKEEIDQHYEVVFKNMFDEVITVRETEDTRLVLNFEDEKIADERLLIVSVHKKNQKSLQSSDYGIKQMTDEEAQLIEDELEELKLELSGQEAILDMLILASFYEQNNLLADALTTYERVITLAPDVEAFKTAYDQFVFRNGLGL